MSDLSSVIGDLEQRRAAIERALSALREISAPRRGRPKKSAAAADAPPVTRKKRVLSPEGRRRIIEATRKRWALKRAAEGAPKKTAPARKKGRSLSAAGRERLSELMKARWASKNPPKPVARKRAS